MSCSAAERDDKEMKTAAKEEMMRIGGWWNDEQGTGCSNI
jgi:hypothetical protein